MNRRIKLLVGLAAGVLLTVSGCSAPGGSTPTSDTLKIGLLVEQTGQFSWYGQEIVEGAKLYQKQHPKAGDFKIEYVTYDTGSDPEKAVTGFRKLVQQDNVAAVIGLGLTNEAAVVAPLALSMKVPLYVLSGSFQPPNEMIFAMPVQIAEGVDRGFATFAKMGIKNIALLTTTDATGQVADALFPKVASKNGMTIVATEHMNVTDVDVTPQLTKIMQKDPDLIVAWELGKPLGVVFNSSQRLSITTPFMISYGNLAPGFLLSLAKTQPPTVYVQATKDVFWKDIPSSDPQAEKVKAFHDDYVKEIGEEPGLGSASGYDSVMMVSLAAQKAKSVSRDKLAKALENLGDVDGIFGTYKVTKDDHVGLDGSDTLLGKVTGGVLSLVAAN